MPRHDKVKINGANGQTGGKNRSSTFVLTAFIFFGLLNIFHFPNVLAGEWKRVDCWISILKS
jgi:hypothetical protein